MKGVEGGMKGGNNGSVRENKLFSVEMINYDLKYRYMEPRRQCSHN